MIEDKQQSWQRILGIESTMLDFSIYVWAGWLNSKLYDLEALRLWTLLCVIEIVNIFFRQMMEEGEGMKKLL